MEGNIINPAEPVEDYLLVMAVAYNRENTVASFGEYAAPRPEQVIGENEWPFQVCFDPQGQEIARQQVIALGR